MSAAQRALKHSYFWLLSLSCAVYKEELLPSDLGADLGGSGGDGSEGGRGAQPALGGSESGSSAGSAGASSGAGGSNTASQGGESSGGESAGGESSGGESSGGESAGGEAGAGGRAGGGAGGNGGAGGGSSGGGNGGSGGKPPEPKCSDHPLSAPASWVVTASHQGVGKDLAAYLIDNKVTRWSTNKAQAGDEWIQIDFGQAVSLSHVNLQQAEANANDYPRSYAVIVSDTPSDMAGKVVVAGNGVTGVSTPITLPSLASGRYLLIKQLGTSLSWWSAVEIEVSCVD